MSSGGGPAVSRPDLEVPFPVPELPALTSPNVCESRARQRRNREFKLHDDHNEAIGALNWLAGCREPNGSAVSVARTVAEDHACVHAQIRASLDDYVGKGAEKTAIPGEEAALRDVLRGRGLYEPGGDINLASFTTPANLSLPTSVHDAPYLDDVARALKLTSLQVKVMRNVRCFHHLY